MRHPLAIPERRVCQVALAHGWGMPRRRLERMPALSLTEPFVTMMEIWVGGDVLAGSSTDPSPPKGPLREYPAKKD